MHEHLAPRLCPHCDAEYDDRRDEAEFLREQYFHLSARRICIVHYDGREPVVLRLLDNGFERVHQQ
jgi:hypothetical protein